MAQGSLDGWWLPVIASLAWPVAGQVLFDGGRPVPPADQGWDYVARQGLAEFVAAGTFTRLDTRLALTEQAGLARLAPVALDRQAGFAIEVVATLEFEEHSSSHRAGFSILVLDEQARGIELGFWLDRVFAQAQEPLFTRAEEAPLDWDDGPRVLALAFDRERYTLHVDARPRLAGPIRDYSAFSGAFGVYRTPNLLFLGDNTASAAASVGLHRVALVPAVRLSPPLTPPPIAIEWSGVPGVVYTVEASSEGADWLPLEQVRSTDDLFRFVWPGDRAHALLRVRYP